MADIKDMTLKDIVEALKGSSVSYAFVRKGFTSLKIDVAGRPVWA